MTDSRFGSLIPPARSRYATALRAGRSWRSHFHADDSNLVNRWNTAMNLAWQQRAFSADHLDILFLALRAELS